MTSPRQSRGAVPCSVTHPSCVLVATYVGAHRSPSCPRTAARIGRHGSVFITDRLLLIECGTVPTWDDQGSAKGDLWLRHC